MDNTSKPKFCPFNLLGLGMKNTKVLAQRVSEGEIYCLVEFENFVDKSVWKLDHELDEPKMNMNTKNCEQKPLIKNRRKWTNSGDANKTARERNEVPIFESIAPFHTRWVKLADLPKTKKEMIDNETVEDCITNESKVRIVASEDKGNN
ncbi:hypothetical protein FQA39_LY14807 [Lamprigera yunnana]|nr:hypothetical protein FQA39_LY14807 [Lamprigera yunnana]